MAPTKTGLDYYSHCIGMTKDRKFRAVRKEYGSAAIDVYIALLDIIYGDKGYYLVYDNTTKDDVVWDVLDYVKGKYAPSPETTEGIIESLVACGLFSGDLFKLGILSSKRIQQQYYSATVERKAVNVLPEIWLIDIDEMKSLSERSPILRFFENRPINEDNRPNSEDNQPNKKQSTEEYSKVQYSTEEESAERSALVSSSSSKSQLIERYGGAAVARYEKKYREWCSKNGRAVKSANMYSTIANWLEEDGVKPKTPSEHSSLDIDAIEKCIMNEYSSLDIEAIEECTISKYRRK